MESHHGDTTSYDAEYSLELYLKEFWPVNDAMNPSGKPASPAYVPDPPSPSYFPVPLAVSHVPPRPSP